MKFLQLVTMALFLAFAPPVAAGDSSNADPSEDQIRLEELAKKIDSMEKRLDALEQALRSQVSIPAIPPSHSESASRRASTSISEVSRLVIRNASETGSGDIAGITSLCRVALESELPTKGFVPVPIEQEADAEIVLAITSTQKGRGFLGITSEDENVNLSYVVLVKSLPDQRVLFKYSNDTDGKPNKACGSFARRVVSELAQAKVAPAATAPK